MKCLAALCGLMLAGSAVAQEPLEQWLKRQTQIRYWQADVLQIRELKGLARPLKAAGKAWIAQPDHMRWELGQPPRTIAIRSQDQLLVHYPRLAETERYVLTGDVNPAGRQALALLQAGFPADAQSFYDNYELTAANRDGARWLLDLKPKSAGSRRLLDAVRLEVDAQSWQLEATEFSFPDGSQMRNEFSGHLIGQAPDPGLFKLDSD